MATLSVTDIGVLLTAESGLVCSVSWRATSRLCPPFAHSFREPCLIPGVTDWLLLLHSLQVLPLLSSGAQMRSGTCAHPEEVVRVSVCVLVGMGKSTMQVSWGSVHGLPCHKQGLRQVSAPCFFPSALLVSAWAFWLVP